jgi:hypothetical protein
MCFREFKFNTLYSAFEIKVNRFGASKLLMVSSAVRKTRKENSGSGLVVVRHNTIHSLEDAFERIQS